MSKKKIIIIIIIALIILGIIIYFVNKNSNDLAINSIVKHDVAEDLYKAVEPNECVNIDINEKVSTQKMNDEVLLYLIFGQMNKDKLLTDNISLNDFNKSAKKILGDVKIPKQIKNYVYDGYVYNLNNDKITREKYNCGDKKYVSKLYGYTTNENQLILNIAVAYIQNGTVYNLDDELLGEYDEENLNEILDKGTMEVYTYTNTNGDYILESISLK